MPRTDLKLLFFLLIFGVFALPLGKMLGQTERHRRAMLVYIQHLVAAKSSFFRRRIFIFQSRIFIFY